MLSASGSSAACALRALSWDVRRLGPVHSEAEACSNGSRAECTFSSLPSVHELSGRPRMKPYSYGPTALLLLGLLSACATAADPTASSDLEVDLTVGIQRQAHEPPFVISSAGSGLLVRGFFHRPCHPYPVSAELKREGKTLILHVIGRDPGACWPALSEIGYQAVLHGVPAGVTHLQIIHSWPDTNRPRMLVYEAPLPPR